MKSTFLKAVKTVALSLALSLGASGVIFANGAGASPTKTIALNGAGNGAGGSTKSRKAIGAGGAGLYKNKSKRRVARKTVKRSKAKTTAQHSMH